MMLTTMAQAAPSKTILFFGDSITAGYGLDVEQAFPALIQKKIDAKKLPYTVVNAGLSGDTTAAGEQRLRWVLRQPADVMVLALGANDGLRGLPVKTMQDNLTKMIRFAREKNPQMKIILAGMRMPPNYGNEYARDFAAVFPKVAQENNVVLIPFLLEGVGGVANLNFPDRIHPTAQGQMRIAETVWKTLEPLLKKS